MKKTAKTLYLIGFIFSILELIISLAYFILGIVANNVALGLPEGFEGFIKLGAGIGWIFVILAAILSLTSFAAMKAIDRVPSWIRPHGLSIGLSLFGWNIFSFIAGFVGLGVAKGEEEKVSIDKHKGTGYLMLTKKEKFVYNLAQFFIAIPKFFAKIGILVGKFVAKLCVKIGRYFKNLVMNFIRGKWPTKVSYAVMGFGNIYHGQVLRGIIFFLFEVVFILYLILVGGKYFGQIGTLGTVAQGVKEVEIGGIIVEETVPGDDSFKILLYSVLTIFFIVAFIYTWNLNIKQAVLNEKFRAEEKRIAKTGDDLRRLLDEDFHKTMLALPVVGITIFTIMPIFFMILVAFTNYDNKHFPPANLFTWVGLENFNQLVSWSNSGGASFSATFGEILVWTLIWAFFATFSNYFLGLMVAMLINKKGIKLKKVWRTILVFSIAIPQFISLLYVSKMFANDGIINSFLRDTFHVSIPFWTDAIWARVTVIIINIWIGIPYLMLITTGILMNIPADLYESSKIDGANPAQQFMKITLPYMLFVTGPYLLTSFTGNMNNFNVIYLLTGGAPKTNEYYGSAGKTDLLITWLFSLTTNDNNYKMASVIGIMVFVVVAVISLVVYNIIPSNKNEEDFS
jgi:arabinogalactan oligomer/maltooligosaccharide transport system permease protein